MIILGFGDNPPGITEPYFKAFADGFFSNFTAKDNFNYSTEHERLAVGTFEENGVTFTFTLKWLDNGTIYYCGFTHPSDSINEVMSNQADILVNTLKPYTAQ